MFDELNYLRRKYLFLSYMHSNIFFYIYFYLIVYVFHKKKINCRFLFLNKNVPESSCINFELKYILYKKKQDKPEKVTQPSNPNTHSILFTNTFTQILPQGLCTYSLSYSRQKLPFLAIFMTLLCIHVQIFRLFSGVSLKILIIFYMR